MNDLNLNDSLSQNLTPTVPNPYVALIKTYLTRNNLILIGCLFILLCAYYLYVIYFNKNTNENKLEDELNNQKLDDELEGELEEGFNEGINDVLDNELLKHQNNIHFDKNNSINIEINNLKKIQNDLVQHQNNIISQLDRQQQINNNLENKLNNIEKFKAEPFESDSDLNLSETEITNLKKQLSDLEKENNNLLNQS
jgi:Ca2+/Na+ antiporter